MTNMTEPGAIDCDVHPTVPDNTALLPYLDEFWRDSVVSRGITSLEFDQLSDPIAARVAAGMARQGRLRGDRPEGARGAGVRSLEGRNGHPQLSLRRAARLQRGHGTRVLPRAQRLHRQRMARPRSADARLDRHPDAERRICGGRDRALRQGQALRAGAGAGDAGGAARAAALSGPSTRPPSATGCHSASIQVQPIAIR